MVAEVGDRAAGDIRGIQRESPGDVDFTVPPPLAMVRAQINQQRAAGHNLQHIMAVTVSQSASPVPLILI